jgi:hypothetical protein
MRPPLWLGQPRYPQGLPDCIWWSGSVNAFWPPCQLILEDEVVVIHGGVTSASREAMRPVINELDALYFYNINYAGGVCDKDVFVVGETPFQKMGSLARYALEHFGTKSYTIAADDNFGHISWKWWDIFWRNGGDMKPVPGGKQGEHVAGKADLPGEASGQRHHIQGQCQVNRTRQFGCTMSRPVNGTRQESKCPVICVLIHDPVDCVRLSFPLRVLVAVSLAKIRQY